MPGGARGGRGSGGLAVGALAVVRAFGGASPAETVRRMLEVVPHRGTASRVVVAGRCAIGVCHRDDDPGATVAVDGQWAAALVGDLDNAAALDAALDGQGQGSAHTPAAVVLRAFRTWGEGAVERFRGAFAGVVWDGSRLWCFRDQVGFQPLFYRSDAQAFYCASEAKQIVAGAGFPREPDPDALETIFYRGIGEDTALKGVKRFLSSPLARVDADGRLVITRYWDPGRILESARVGPAEARERLIQVLDQAVTRVVTGRDAVALSGGIDSPTVAAFAAPAHMRAAGRPLVAITMAYPDFPSVDEGSYVRQVAEFLDIPVRSHVLTGTPLDDVERWTALADGPWDTLPMPLVAQEYRLARELGVRAVLTGDLAEYVYTISASLLGHLFWHGRWRGLARHTAALRARGTSWPAVARRVAREGIPWPLGGLYMRLRSRPSRRIPDWVDRGVLARSLYRPDLAGPARQRWRRAQLTATQGISSTQEADEICAAACGVRVRRPLADVDLWEFFLSLPAEVKFPDPTPKALVRQAMRGRLPDAILDRRTKTVYDDHAMSTADYPAMRRWIDPSRYRMRGVDYVLLRQRIEQGTMSLLDLLWAHDLVKVHAFVSSWE